VCGRFTRYLPWSEVHRLYRLTLDWEKQRNDAPAYNIAPTDQVPFVTAGEDGAHKLVERVSCPVMAMTIRPGVTMSILSVTPGVRTYCWSICSVSRTSSILPTWSPTPRTAFAQSIISSFT
jgi:hypothetical protein